MSKNYKAKMSAYNISWLRGGEWAAAADVNAPTKTLTGWINVTMI